MIKNLFFDFDGVLLNSIEIKTNAFKRLLTEYDTEKTHKFIKYHKENLGISRFIKFRYFYEKILLEEYSQDIENKLAEKFTSILRESLYNAALIPGAKEFLCEFSKRYNCFIVSGGQKDEIITILKSRNLLACFKNIYGGDRSKKEILKDIFDTYNYQPKQSLFIGDARTDLEAASFFNISFIGIDYGNEKKIKCKYLYSDLKNLHFIIDKISQDLDGKI